MRSNLPNSGLRRALGVGSLIPLLTLLAWGCARSPDKSQVGQTAEPATVSKAASRGAVLVVLSSSNSLPLKEGKAYKTGYFLNELMVPVRALIAANYTPVFATPDGTAAVMDPHSDSPSFFANEAEYREILALRHSLGDIQKTRSLHDIVAGGLESYRALVIPGGHAAMGDLPESIDLGRVLRHFHERHKPTALICHGPGALLSALPHPHAFADALARGDAAATTAEGSSFPYAGYNVTVFSSAEEKTVEDGGPNAFLGGKVLFYLDDALKAAGAHVEIGEPWKSHVVRDRELISAQQPASDAEFTRALLAALAEPTGAGADSRAAAR